MNWSELLEIGGKVKIEMTLEELRSFADYIIQNSTGNISSKKSNDFDIGGIELAMEVTGYAKSTIYNMVSENKIPYYRKHGRLYFSRSDLIDHIKSGKNDNQDSSSNILR